LLRFTTRISIYEKGSMKKLVIDICVYGGTSGGVTAAIAAAQQGRSVVLIEPSRHLGGMTSGGLGWTDYGRIESIGGLSREFFRRVEAWYHATGLSPDEWKQGVGWTHEPHVAETIFKNWLAEYHVEVVYEHRVATAHKDGSRLRAIVLDHAPPDDRGAPTALAAYPAALQIEAAQWIDASYEGDLMAAANVSYQTSREAAKDYGESVAGVIYNHHEDLQGRLIGTPSLEAATFDIDPYQNAGDPQSGLLPWLVESEPELAGEASSALQAYNFRLCLTDDPQNRVPIEAPNYDPAQYELLGRYLELMERRGTPLTPDRFHQNWHVLKISPLPNRKSDVNNAGPFSTDLTGANYRYPEGDWKTRSQIWHAHEDYQRGFHVFLRTDARVPVAVREEVQRWGLCRDEFTDTGHWPSQLYVRESRRLRGSYIMTQSDCEGENPVVDSVGMGSYSLDSHSCQRFAWRGAVVKEGGYIHRIKKPYGISYRALVPRENECENLAVIFCLSSSHAAYSSLRMEPVLMILGQSAAVAVCQALESNRSLQTINVSHLQKHLREGGQVLEIPS
jgi:hypothetical protein